VARRGVARSRPREGGGGGREGGDEKGRAPRGGSCGCRKCGERNGVLVPFSWVMGD
jgi:hypothetical protein